MPSHPRRRARSAPGPSPAAAPAPGDAARLEKLLVDLELRQTRVEQLNAEIAEAHRELERSHRRYADLYELAPVGFLSLDRRGLIKQVNRAAADVLGYPRRMLLGRPMAFVVAKGDAQRFYNHLARTAKSRSRTVAEVRIIRQDKSTAGILLTSVWPKGSPEFPAAYLTAIVELPERAPADEPDRHGYGVLAEYAHDWEYWLGPDGCFVYVSPSCERITGYPPTLFLNQPGHLARIVHPEDRAAAIHDLLDASDAAGQDDRQFRILRRDGCECWVSLVRRPMHDRSGAFLGVRGTIRDISDQKRIQTALSESEGQYRLLFEASPVPILLFDSETLKILAANAAAERFYGYPPEDLLGLAVEQLCAANELPVLLGRAACDGGLPPNWTGESWHRRKDGTLVDVSVTVGTVPFRGAAARLAIVKDLTEQKRAEAELRLLNEDLARSNRDLEQFAYAASHDLQEPLHAVSGLLGLLDRRLGSTLDEQAHAYIKRVLNGTERMRRLIDDLLAFSRVGAAGKGRSPVDAGEVLDEVLKDLEPALQSAGATVRRAALPVVRADRAQLGSLFQNLIGNAVKFRRDGVPPEVGVDASRNGGQWEFAVSDNGIGIDARHHEQVFKIFQRLHDGAKYPGTGMGLAICRKIVERHGGRIWLESQPGVGTTVRFTLPA